MRKYISKKVVYSNCLFFALYVRFRVKGSKLVMLTPNWGNGNYFGHFIVKKGDYMIDFDSMIDNLPCIRQLWFKGRLQMRKLQYHPYFDAKMKPIVLF